MNTERKWLDRQGRTVPDSHVTDAEKMKDELAERLVSSAEAMRASLKAFKDAAMGEMYAAKGLLFEKYGAQIGGKKGGFGLTTYDGSAEVKIEIADRIVFGPELQAAKALIDECLEDWARSANDNLRLLVEDAFSVNKAGRIDTKRVLGLRKFNMKNDDGTPDQRWVQAMEAITDALIFDQTTTYIRFYRRDDRTNELDRISLDISSL